MEEQMNQKINPVVGVVIAIVVAIGIGFLSWKLAFHPRGDYAPVPASASNPNSGGPPKR